MSETGTHDGSNFVAPAPELPVGAELIDSVPGMNRAEEPPAQRVEQGGAYGNGVVVVERPEGSVVHDANFRGDPRRVLGHQSNPTSNLHF